MQPFLTFPTIVTIVPQITLKHVSNVLDLHMELNAAALSLFSNEAVLDFVN